MSRTKATTTPSGFKLELTIDELYTFLMTTGITLTACSANNTNKQADSLINDSEGIGPASNSIGGLTDIFSTDTIAVKKDNLYLDTM